MSQRKAFTIVELMLAMAFLGTMLLGIASLVVRITNIYQKGLSVRAINSVGRELISDITRTVNASRVNHENFNPATTGVAGDIVDKAINEARSKYFIETTTADSTVANRRQLGGVFCTGDYSYVWNTADNLRKARSHAGIKEKDYRENGNIRESLNEGVFVIKVRDGSKDSFIIPKFARFADYDREACTSTYSTTSQKYVPAENNGIKKGNAYRFDFTKDANLKSSNDIVELIEDSESDLALYNFTIFPAMQHSTTKQIFYSGMFILATYRGGVNIKSNGDFCQGSSDIDTGERDNELTLNDFDYCAVNKFNFAARATGETSIKQHGDR